MKKLTQIAKKWHKFAALHETVAVDKGHFAIYTADQRRFVVPLAYLNCSIFRQLLKMSEEEYGLPRNGPIVLPCDSVFMDYAICLIRQGGDVDRLHEDSLVSVARSRCLSSSSWCVDEGQMNRQMVTH